MNSLYSLLYTKCPCVHCIRCVVVAIVRGALEMECIQYLFYFYYSYYFTIFQSNPFKILKEITLTAARNEAHLQ